YFNQGMSRNVIAPIDITWTAPDRFRVEIAYALRWDVALTQSPGSRTMNAMATLVPELCWQNRTFLRATGAGAGAVLGTGPLSLTGRTPNGQEFVASPSKMWLIGETRAMVNDVDAGLAGAVGEQARLQDFLIPQRGVFAVARA